MNEISEFVDVTITIDDLRISQAGFGTILILPIEEHSAFTDRVKSYNNISEVLVDFATTTKTYKAANAIFAQDVPPSTIKIGRRDAADGSDYAVTLAAIETEDNDWYALLTESAVKADILICAAWIETKRKIYIPRSQDSDIKTDVETDLAYLIKNSGYNRTGLMYHHQSGVDLTGLDISVSGGIATVTKIAHGLLVNDPVTVSGATPTELNGNKTVASVPTDDTFTYASTSSDGPATGTITAFANYVFPDGAWLGEVMGKYVPGEATWAFKQLTGINKTPNSLMNSSEKALVLGKNANVYVEVASVGITQNGTMASSRFIDIQRSIDWLQARMEEAVFLKLASLSKIAFTNKGTAIIENEMRAVLDEGLRRNVLQPLLNDEENRPYIVFIPDVADVSSANRTNRILPDCEFTGQLAGAIHNVQIAGKIQV